MRPIYAQNIIVGIMSNQNFNWYILNKDFCYLDYTKLRLAYQARGYPVPQDDAWRFGIQIVDKSSKIVFLENISPYMIHSSALQKMLSQESNYNEQLAYNPSIWIDFDRKEFISHYAEPEPFENFVPEGWTGMYGCFENKIPHGEKYWIDKNGKNLIGGKVNE